MSIESLMLSSHLILCHPLLLLSSVFPNIRVFSNESALHIRWPKYWSFSFSISPFNEYSGLISFRTDWFDLHAVQGTLSIVFSRTTVQKLQFFGTQSSFGPPSNPYMTGKTLILTIWIFISKVMSLHFNTLSRSVIAFLQRIQHILISRLQSLLLLQWMHTPQKVRKKVSYLSKFLRRHRGPV